MYSINRGQTVVEMLFFRAFVDTPTNVRPGQSLIDGWLCTPSDKQ